MGNKIMAYWDCRYCGCKAQRGDNRNCTGCGHPRDESVTFYMLDHEYVSEEEAAKITAGPDWHCPYCGGLNKSADAFCGGCGAPASASTQDYYAIQEEKKRREAERLAAEEAERMASMPAPAAPVKKKKKPWWLWLILFAIIASVVVCLWPKTKDAVVKEHAWETVVHFEEKQKIIEEDWSMPRDAELIQSYEDIYGYDQVLDHYEDVQVAKQREITVYETVISYEDLGNGYFEEISTEVPHTEYETYYETESQPVYVAVPIYKTKYKYAVWRWIPQRDVVNAGSGMEPAFLTMNYTDNQRETGRETKYILKVESDKRIQEFVAKDKNVFEKIKDGEEVIIRTQGASADLYDRNQNRIGTKK